MELKDHIRTVPDWPKKGIQFRDITTLLSDPDAFDYACKQLYERYKDKGIDKVIGIESRGFIFGSVLARDLHVGFIPVRKPGKLPAETISETYDLEYGSDEIHIHKDAVKQGERVLIVDDLIATGGTAAATINLLRKLGAEIAEAVFVIELPDLKGREKFDCAVYSMMSFEGD